MVGVGVGGSGSGEIMGLFHKEPPEAWGNFVLSITDKVCSRAQSVSQLVRGQSQTFSEIVQSSLSSNPIS